MTNEEAIELLQTPIHCADKGDEKDMREALSMAIKALENHDTFMKYSYEQGKKDALSQEPCRVKNELNVELNELKPCTDAVSREAVKDLIKSGVSTDTSDDVVEVCKWIDALPSVTQKSGKWQRVSIEKYIQHAMAYYVCSECGGQTIGEPKFCPNCGARMESEVRNDTNRH